MEKKIVVYALFDDGEQSVYNALDKDKYDVYSFGIQVKPTTHYLDMSKLFILKELEKFPKPDLILASPPCESFSMASGMKGGNACYIKKNGIWTNREVDEFTSGQYKYENQVVIREIGKQCLINTLIIIKHFKVPFYIENPKSSIMWWFIENVYLNDWFRNNTYYGNYNSELCKPTCFMANIDLQLNNVKPKGPFKNVKRINGDSRSQIPSDLINEIVEKLWSNRYDQTRIDWLL